MENSTVHRILAVDDDAVHRILNCQAVQSLGYRCVTAEDGEFALILLKEVKFAAVISDISMPYLDGFGLLRAMSKLGYLTHTPVIMVTSESGPGDKQRALDLGASAYLPKPVVRADLKDALGKVLGWANN